MIFIGDVHGQYGRYFQLCKKYRQTIQLGDLGSNYSMIESNLPISHKFIWGNHDYLYEAEACKNFIPDGTTVRDMMFIGGADHFVHKERLKKTPGLDWVNIRDKYEQARPRIMVTHDCPSTAGRLMDRWGDYIPDRFSSFFDELFQIHQPEYWVFGHWHQSRSFLADGCRFRCVDILEVFEL